MRPSTIVRGVVALFALYAVIFGITDVRTQRTCLDRGFPSYEVLWNLNQYCIKRVNQTDIVVKL